MTRLRSRPGRLVALFFFAFVALAARPFVASVTAASVRLFGVDYVDAREFGARFGLDAHWLSANQQLRLQSKWTKLDFTVDDTDIWLNGLRLFLAEPVVAHAGSLYLSRRDADHLLAPILNPGAKKPVPRLKTIVIDAGHGGRDPGNQNPRLHLQEKKMTLDVAHRLGRLLRARGYRVVQTRDSDRFVDFDDRTGAVRRAHADLFISIHFNAFSDPSVAGTETYVLTPAYQRSSPQAERDRSMMRTHYPGNRYDHWNTLLGYHLHRQLVERLGRPDRGLKRFRYLVLRDARCPAVLVEAAFLTNPAEGRLVATAAYRQKIAAALAAGIDAHAQALQRLRS